MQDTGVAGDSRGRGRRDEPTQYVSGDETGCARRTMDSETRSSRNSHETSRKKSHWNHDIPPERGGRAVKPAVPEPIRLRPATLTGKGGVGLGLAAVIDASFQISWAALDCGRLCGFNDLDFSTTGLGISMPGLAPYRVIPTMIGPTGAGTKSDDNRRLIGRVTVLFLMKQDTTMNFRPLHSPTASVPL